MIINDYFYKPVYPIFKDKKRRYGIELEVVVKEVFDRYKEDHEYIYSNTCTRIIRNVAKELDKFFEGWCILKKDGSIPCGFEIVTEPLLRQEQENKWTSEVFDHLSNVGCISYAAETAGQHCHVSRAALSALQISKALRFLHNKDNRLFLKKIAQREDKHYAEFSSAKRFNEYKKPFPNKYQALNLGPKDTVEFRLFKGTINHEAFHKNIQFCDALLDFCAPCITDVSSSLNWWSFINFVSNNKNNYSPLWSYCKLKNIDSVDSWQKHRAEIIEKKRIKEGESKQTASLEEDRTLNDIILDPTILDPTF